MENLESYISRHNKRVLAKGEPMESWGKLCDCRIPGEWPLQKMFSEDYYSFQGANRIEKNKSEWRRIISKCRYRNHMKSFEHKIYEYDTELSKYVWKLKNILGKTTELNG
jgi:hypothetical protein